MQPTAISTVSKFGDRTLMCATQAFSIVIASEISNGDFGFKAAALRNSAQF